MSTLARSAVVAAVALLMLAAQAPRPPEVPPGTHRVGIPLDDGTELSGYLRRPPGAGDAPTPAVIMLHGCSGMFTRTGRIRSREADWSQRLADWGYAALLLDSFTPRGVAELCSLASEDRTLHPEARADDGLAALAWLARQPFVDPERIALMGWSNGGSTTLWAAARGAAGGAALRTAIAFYPGCRVPAHRRSWAPRTPLAILIGSDDDWTKPDTCREIVERFPEVRLVEYPGAVHDFDAPNAPLRERRNVGVSSTGAGRARVGTDPAARAAAIREVEGILAAAFGTRH